MSNDRVHHPYSPSTLQSREACPKYQPAHSENEAAARGTKQHAVSDSGTEDASLSDLHNTTALLCRAASEERAASCFAGGVILREAYLPVDDQETTAGFVDFAAVSADGKHAMLDDYKYGKYPVTPAKDNLQGISYMLGIKHKFPTLETCTVRFLQPHIEYETEFTFEISNPGPYLLRVRAVVLRAIEAAKIGDDFSLATATVSTCLFCGLVGRCPKVAALALAVGRKYAPLKVPDTVTPSSVFDAVDAAAGLMLAQVMDIWSKAYRACVTARALDDELFMPEGYQLVTASKRRVLRAVDLANKAKEFLPESAHAAVDGLFEMPLTALEDLISLHAARNEKDETVALFGKQANEEGLTEEGREYSYLKQTSTPKTEE